MNLDRTTPQIDAAGQKTTLVPWDLNSTLPKKKIFANWLGLGQCRLYYGTFGTKVPGPRPSRQFFRFFHVQIGPPVTKSTRPPEL